MLFHVNKANEHRQTMYVNELSRYTYSLTLLKSYHLNT